MTTVQEMVERALAPPDPAYSLVAMSNEDFVHDLSYWETIDWTDSAQAYWMTPSQLTTLT
jgi:hypothetical protein